MSKADKIVVFACMLAGAFVAGLLAGESSCAAACLQMP